MISVVVPSRGRPYRIRDMWASARETAAKRIELVTYLDLDDTTVDEYPNWAKTVIGPRCVLSEAWNRAATQAKGDILMMGGDDLLFRTHRWDVLVEDAVKAYEDRIVLVHVNDGYQNEAIATHPFVTRRWYETMGMLCPPYFTADYNDVWLQEVATRIGRHVYRPDVLIEHIHPDAGKTAMDQTYVDQRLRRWNDAMPQKYDSLEATRVEWANKLKGAMWAQPPTLSSAG